VVALLGPNGAGKTTALRLLAGLLDGGRVVLDGVPLDGLPPEQRRVGLVPQDGLLLPHLSALDNVAYGLRARGARKAPARARAREELDRLGLADRADARPRELSGGQAQRVALGRALATDPALLLLDEPLAALDALTRTDVRSDLRARLQAFAGPTVLVTHDPVDALVLADRLVVLEDGRVVQSGAPADVAAHPRTAYVAGLVGLVLLRGTGRDGGVDLDGGARLPVPSPDGPVHVAFPPQAVQLREQPQDGAWPVVVRALEQQGAVVRVRLEGPPSLTATVPAARLDLRTGARLWARVDPQDVAVYA
jgi:molybdate transport system ATP-binding protein